MSIRQPRREPAGTREGGRFAPDTAGKDGIPAAPAAPVAFKAPARSDLDGRELGGARLADLTERLLANQAARDARPTAREKALDAIDDALARVSELEDRRDRFSASPADPDASAGEWQSLADALADARDALAAARADYDRLDPHADRFAPALPAGIDTPDAAFDAGVDAGRTAGRREAGREIAAMLAEQLGAAWDPHEGQWVLDSDYGRTILPGLPAPRP